jgi:hypothetical protein
MADSRGGRVPSVSIGTRPNPILPSSGQSLTYPEGRVPPSALIHILAGKKARRAGCALLAGQVHRSVRRVTVATASAHSFQNEFALAHAKLTTIVAG